MPKRYIPVKERWQHYHEASILAFVGGWVNTVGFIALFGIYTNHVTGYIVTAGKETILGGLGVWALFLGSFILTIGITAWCEQRWKQRYPNILLAFLITETLLLTLFMLAGIFFSPFESLVDTGAIITAMLGISAMGIRNAVIRTLLSSMATSTLMTGNIAQLTIDTVIAYGSTTSSSETKDSARQNISKILPSVLSFAFGALLGALAYIMFSFICIIVPILLMTYLCYRESDFGFSQA
ncbi:YoaK family protein [Acinetobacter colistiniresistens]|uniref:YoaK family protein n=1 Tax=Acinetobacter colistiniresistens TaxID=280145 RepID=UPI002FE359A1